MEESESSFGCQVKRGKQDSNPGISAVSARIYFAETGRGVDDYGDTQSTAYVRVTCLLSSAEKNVWESPLTLGFRHSERRQRRLSRRQQRARL